MRGVAPGITGGGACPPGRAFSGGGVVLDGQYLAKFANKFVYHCSRHVNARYITCSGVHVNVPNFLFRRNLKKVAKVKTPILIEIVQKN